MTTSTTGQQFSPVDRFFEFSLLGLLTSGYLAVAGSGFLDLPTLLLTACALILRALLVAGVIQISPKVVAAVALGYMGFYPIDNLYISKGFMPATVHLVLFIASIKILTASTNRDYLFVKLIAFMELLAACVLSSSFNFSLFLALFLVLGVATFMSSEIRSASQKFPQTRPSRRGTAWRLSGVAVTVSVGILVMTGLLFFLLPRTARVALRTIFQHRYHLAGFSNEVNLGEIGEVKKQDTPVMHVRMAMQPERPVPLRWRGSALAQFDGRRWFNTPAKGEVLRPDSATGTLELGPWRRRRSLSYSVHLNDAAPDGALFFAGTPQSIRIDAPLVIRTPTDSYRLIGGGYTGLNYQVFSYLEPSGNEPPGTKVIPAPDALTPAVRQSDLQLPLLDGRIWDLAQKVTEADETPDGKARLLEKYLRKTYGYTLELPQTESSQPLADFLFRRRKGHCEYFASAMAVMLRTIGIPSRVVTGFAGGVFNPISGWYVVRASDAHSWVEAYLPHLGWTTFDPTPPDPNPPQVSMFSRLGFYIDAAEVFWQDWVLNYNLDRQVQLASRMEQTSRGLRLNWFDDFTNPAARWKGKASDFGSAYGAAGVAIAVFAFVGIRYGRDILRWWKQRLRFRRVQRGQVNRSDATLMYERMLKSLKRRGIEKPVWLTPAEFAGAVQDGEIQPIVREITSAYNDLRFGGRTEAGPRMMQLIAELESAR
jgi:transglutaminase-like putative cysteine protease